MKAVWIMSLSLALAGCESAPDLSVKADQCMRQQVFKECMSLTPTMPTVKVDQSTGDWAEVVNACSNHAYYVSKRPVETIPEGCK